MSDVVSKIRQRIDELDNTIHDLLMERAGLVLEIGEEKRKNDVQVVQPDREIVMIRRLLARHKGPLPREAVVRIWRELVGAVSLLQTGLKVAVTVPDGSKGLNYWDMAKDYFSSVLPMQKAGNEMAALAMVREGDVTFSVMPWPEDRVGVAPWWTFLIEESGAQAMRIVGRLPLGNRREGSLDPEFRALVVARLKFEPSGDDRTFAVLEVDDVISRGRVVEILKQQGLVVRNLYVYKPGANIPGGQVTFLLEIEGYIGEEDGRLEQAFSALDSPQGKAVVLGGYPVPPVYDDKVGKNAVEPLPDIDG